MGAVVTVIKWLVFIFNFIFFLTGCALLAVGIWLNVDRKDWEDISDYNYISVANVAIAAGVIIIVFAFLGCCGAITENKIMLLMFFIFILVVFALELGGGIAAYVWRDKVEDELVGQVRKRIPDRYWVEDGIRKAVDAVQNHFDCCGVDSWYDWNNGTKKMVPASCCKAGTAASCNTTTFADAQSRSSSYVTNKPCYLEIRNFIKDNLLYVGICALVFAGFQVLGMVFSMVLFCHIRGESRTV